MSVGFVVNPAIRGSLAASTIDVRSAPSAKILTLRLSRCTLVTSFLPSPGGGALLRGHSLGCSCPRAASPYGLPLGLRDGEGGVRDQEVPDHGAESFGVGRHLVGIDRRDHDTGVGHACGISAVTSDDADDRGPAPSARSRARTRFTDTSRSASPPPTENTRTQSSGPIFETLSQASNVIPSPRRWSEPSAPKRCPWGRTPQSCRSSGNR